MESPTCLFLFLCRRSVFAPVFTRSCAALLKAPKPRSCTFPHPRLNCLPCTNNCAHATTNSSSVSLETRIHTFVLVYLSMYPSLATEGAERKKQAAYIDRRERKKQAKEAIARHREVVHRDRSTETCTVPLPFFFLSPQVSASDSLRLFLSGSGSVICVGCVCATM